MSQSLRSRIEAKARRRVVYPVQVTDPTAAAAALAEAERLVALYTATTASDGASDEDRERLAKAEALRDAARTQHAEHYVEVTFQALSPADFEALAAGYRDDEGDLDTANLGAPLAAACAVDEDLRDEAWWAEQLAGGAWNTAEVSVLTTTLLQLNYSSPSALVPKD